MALTRRDASPKRAHPTARVVCLPVADQSRGMSHVSKPAVVKFCDGCFNDLLALWVVPSAADPDPTMPDHQCPGVSWEKPLMVPLAGMGEPRGVILISRLLAG